MSNNEKENHRITGKLVLHGTLKTKSPLLIGKGMGDEADTEVMLMPDGKPYIPASSLVGALRSRFIEAFGEKGKVKQKSEAEAFWGSDEMKKKNGQPRDDTCQSHLIVDDLQLSKNSHAKIVIRDGVAINPKTGTALPNAKYDYQLVEPESKFDLRMEVTIREGMDKDKQIELLRWVKETLASDNFRIGALTNFGFGKFDSKEGGAWAFDFSDKENGHADMWFTYLKGQANKKIFKWEGGEIKWDKVMLLSGENEKKHFHIKAYFTLKSALITGSYGVRGADPDKTHLTSKGKPVLSGKSIKGAIRRRALMILNTLQPDEDANNHHLIDHLFGWIEHRNDPYAYLNKKQSYDKKAIRSRLRIEETELNGTVKSMTQDRIKIDRFTGGVMHGAKFDSQPVWNNVENGKEVKNGFKITFTLFNYQNWEATLLLHLLKDLWTSDLAIGGEKNVGRGILEGQKAVVRFYDDVKKETKEVEIYRNGEEAKLRGDLKDLDVFNKSLPDLIKESVNIIPTA